ncbi:MAG: hypothetical protein ACFCUX_08665 [Candidatus Methylacidiphilales bacterium]
MTPTGAGTNQAFFLAALLGVLLEAVLGALLGALVAAFFRAAFLAGTEGTAVVPAVAWLRFLRLRTFP